MHARMGMLVASALLVSACPPGGQTGIDPDPPGPGPILGLVTVDQTTLSDGRIERELTIQVDNRVPTKATPAWRCVATTSSAGGEVVEGEVIVPAIAPGVVAGTPDTMTVRLPASASLAAIQLSLQTLDANGAWQMGPIGASGGTIAKPNGSAGATFAAGFAAGTVANLYEVDVPRDRSLFNDTARIFTTNGADRKALRIEVWQAPPGETVHVWMMPAAAGRMLWVRVPESDVEEFVPVATTVRSDGAIEGDIPAAAFKADSANGSYEALVVTAAPTAHPRSAPVTHYCPLPSCVVTSSFSDARLHPVLGITRPHYGVDYRADNGTTVTASAAGTVERSYSSETYGETIIIRHDDGSATLYAHLSRRDVFYADLVEAGEEIGLAGSTGLADGVHLHFELVLEGDVIGGVRVDPVVYVVLPTFTVSISAYQQNLDSQIWGTQNAILWDGAVRGYFAEYATGTATITHVAQGTHTVRIGYSGGLWPQVFPGAYLVVASLSGGTWTASPPPDAPTYDSFTLTPSWYPGLWPTQEGSVWRTFTVTVP